MSCCVGSFSKYLPQQCRMIDCTDRMMAMRSAEFIKDIGVRNEITLDRYKLNAASRPSQADTALPEYTTLAYRAEFLPNILQKID